MSSISSCSKIVGHSPSGRPHRLTSAATSRACAKASANSGLRLRQRDIVPIAGIRPVPAIDHTDWPRATLPV
jgi:hypothetical protein